MAMICLVGSAIRERASFGDPFPLCDCDPALEARVVSVRAANVSVLDLRDGG